MRAQCLEGSGPMRVRGIPGVRYDQHHTGAADGAGVLLLLLGGEMTGQTVVVSITEQRVLTEGRPVLTEERLQLFEVGGGGGDYVVAATANSNMDGLSTNKIGASSKPHLCCCFAW